MDASIFATLWYDLKFAVIFVFLEEAVTCSGIDFEDNVVLLATSARSGF